MNKAYDSEYHKPVMLQETLEALAIKSNGVYVDCTFGGGGHSRAILDNLGPEGVLVAFDQDPDAQNNVPQDSRLHFVPQNFSQVKSYLRFLGHHQVDGLLADFGVSSHQFDVPDRGFSIRYSGKLDMRMDTTKGKSALELLSSITEDDLAKVLRLYGEIKSSRKVAKTIKLAVDENPQLNTEDLVGQLRPLAGANPKNQKQFLAQVFQAIRIEVNQEMAVLYALLEDLKDVIKPEGRAVFIAYHSLEDRAVKNMIRSGNLEGKQDKDLYGNLNRPFKPLQSKPMVPSAEEIEHNPRSRSAKLRVAVKL